MVNNLLIIIKKERPSPKQTLLSCCQKFWGLTMNRRNYIICTLYIILYLRSVRKLVSGKDFHKWKCINNLFCMVNPTFRLWSLFGRVWCLFAIAISEGIFATGLCLIVIRLRIAFFYRFPSIYTKSKHTPSGRKIFRYSAITFKGIMKTDLRSKKFSTQRRNC